MLFKQSFLCAWSFNRDYQSSLYLRSSVILTLISFFILFVAIFFTWSLFRGIDDFNKEKILKSFPHIYIFNLFQSNDAESILNLKNQNEFIELMTGFYEENVMLLDTKLIPLRMQYFSNPEVLTKKFALLKNDKEGIYLSFHSSVDVNKDKIEIINFEKQISSYEIIASLNLPEDIILKNNDKSKKIFQSYWLWLEKSKNLIQAKTKIQEELGYRYKVVTWKEMHASLFTYLRLQKITAVIIIGIFCLLISALLVTLVNEQFLAKKQEINLLTLLGFSQEKIMKLFLYASGSIILIAALCALPSSIFLIKNLNPFLFLLEDQFNFEILPRSWQLQGLPFAYSFLEFFLLIILVFFVFLFIISLRLKCLTSNMEL